MISRALIGLVLVAFVAGCDEGSGSADDQIASAVTAQTSEPAVSPPEPATATESTPEVPAAAPALEEIVRAWSRALNAGDNEAAADLFALPALVVQGGVAIELRTREQVVAWNEGLPCSGTIISTATNGDVVTAVFALGDRATSACDAPAGTPAAAQFLIVGGLIAVWRQIPPPQDGVEPPPAPEEPDAPVA